MRLIGALLVAAAGLVPAAQETSEAAGKWIDQLRADSLEMREEASLHLEKMGPRARGDLEKAAKSSDREVSTRAQWLLGLLRIKETVPEGLAGVFPGIARRLADDKWVEVLGEAAKAREPVLWLHPGLSP